MRRLSVREREVVPVGGDGPLSEREAEAFAALGPRLPSGALERQHWAIRFGPFCGVIRVPGLTVEVLPKTGLDARPDEDARGVLVAMLAAAGHLRVAHPGAAGLGRQSRHLLDVFILDFCGLVAAALRGGPITRYVKREENLRAVRGRLQLTEHLRRNAFDHSRVLCRFDERSLDNAHNRVLKSVIGQLCGQALGGRAKAMATSLLHRFDAVADLPARAADVDALTFDRTTEGWRGVFAQAGWLLRRLYPDVRVGDAEGSALLFDMERLFEAVLGRRIARLCAHHPGLGLRVVLQGPPRTLADGAFGLRPDVAVTDAAGKVIAILDAKWKHLDPAARSGGVASADAYQLAAYAGRYDCQRLALVYPASPNCPAGQVRSHRLLLPGAPRLDVVALELTDLAAGRGVPAGLGSVLGIGSG